MRATSVYKLEAQEADTILPKTSSLETRWLGCLLEEREVVEKINFLHMYKRSSLHMSSSAVVALFFLSSFVFIGNAL